MATLFLILNILVIYVVPIVGLVLLVLILVTVRRIGRTQRVDELVLAMDVAAARMEFALDEATAQRLATALRLAHLWEAGELSRAECGRVTRAVAQVAELPLVRDADASSPFLAVRRFARHWSGA